jgi:glycosyltransferase involved in cell wall biosynthesis
VSQHFWPENFRINDLVAELVARGHDVTVLTGLPNYPDGDIYPEFAAQPGRFTRYAGADIVRVPMVARGRSTLQLMLNFASFAVSGALLGPWRLRGRRFDAVFTFLNSPATAGLPATLLAALKSAPLIFWVLDLWPETLRAVGAVRSPLILRAVGRLMAFMYNRCAVILAQSRSFVPQIGRYCRHPERVVYFPNWAESLFKVAEAEPAPEVPLHVGSFDVMFAGNIGEAQDFPAILAAAEELRTESRIRWLIVGDGRMAGWVAAEVERRGLQQQVLLLGRFPVERMPSFYLHAGALLVSLKDDPIFAMTIPGKLQSYLAAGVPIVAMLNGEGADVIERARAGATCRAGDSAGLAAAVRRLANSSDTALAEMSRNALALSATEFDRHTLINRLEHWLAKAASNGHPGVT